MSQNKSTKSEFYLAIKYSILHWLLGWGLLIYISFLYWFAAIPWIGYIGSIAKFIFNVFWMPWSFIYHYQGIGFLQLMASIFSSFLWVACAINTKKHFRLRNIYWR
ncbi:hypothetical protein ACFX58_19375 [Sphingomonas sp. NCPPB 2930]